jgi:hypothetical protein
MWANVAAKMQQVRKIKFANHYENGPKDGKKENTS